MLICFKRHFKAGSPFSFLHSNTHTDAGCLLYSSAGKVYEFLCYSLEYCYLNYWVSIFKVSFFSKQNYMILVLIQRKQTGRTKKMRWRDRQKGKIFSLLFLALNLKLVQKNVSRTSSNIQLNHPCDNLTKYPDPKRATFKIGIGKRWLSWWTFVSSYWGSRRSGRSFAVLGAGASMR